MNQLQIPSHNFRYLQLMDDLPYYLSAIRYSAFCMFHNISDDDLMKPEMDLNIKLQVQEEGNIVKDIDVQDTADSQVVDNGKTIQTTKTKIAKRVRETRENLSRNHTTVLSLRLSVQDTADSQVVDNGKTIQTTKTKIAKRVRETRENLSRNHTTVLSLRLSVQDTAGSQIVDNGKTIQTTKTKIAKRLRETKENLSRNHTTVFSLRLSVQDTAGSQVVDN
ncbi:hypothetical protein TNCV_5090361 [Trichonephila clavipes]|nr:hypothetical protein TNCV_5090361 [Trichonephila clavipes]